MAKIQELLDNLLHKKLGRDVRQSIHDSIEQCYKDATGHPESVAGVIEENKNMQKQLDSNINTINGRIDTILTGAVNTTKLVTVHSATIRNNSASDLTFKISSKDNETLKSIKDKSPTVINANVIAKALDGVAINGKGIPSSYNVESTNDEYVITVYSGSSSVVGQYVFMAVVTIAYEDIATDISSAELKDVRAGADGTVYKSAGEAVRGQIGQLKESLNEVDKKVDNLSIETDTTLTQSGKPADAKATGDRLDGHDKLIGKLSKLKYSDTSSVQSILKEIYDKLLAPKPLEDVIGTDIPEVFITASNFDEMTKENRIDVNVAYKSDSLTWSGFADMKWQGSSSLSYPKKNFTIRFYADESKVEKQKFGFTTPWCKWGNENKFVMKANYIDHSHARNIVCARLWSEMVKSRSNYNNLPDQLKNSPNNWVIDGFPIKVTVNGTYQGVYTMNIPKDKWVFDIDDNDTKQAVLCGESNNSAAEPACMYRGLAKIDGGDWSLEVPDVLTPSIKTSFNKMIAFVQNATDDALYYQLDDYLDVESVIDYYLFVYFGGMIDSLGKNQMIVTIDGEKWYYSAYDMDSTFGLYINGNMFVASTIQCPEQYMTSDNLLFQRVEEVFGKELKARYSKLRENLFTLDHIGNLFENFMNIIGNDLYAKDLTVYNGIPQGNVDHLKQIKTYITERTVYVDQEINNLEEKEHTFVPVKSVSLNKNTLNLSNGVNGFEAIDVSSNGVVAQRMILNNAEISSNDTKDLLSNAIPLTIEDGYYYMFAYTDASQSTARFGLYDDNDKLVYSSYLYDGNRTARIDQLSVAFSNFKVYVHDTNDTGTIDSVKLLKVKKEEIESRLIPVTTDMLNGATSGDTTIKLDTRPGDVFAAVCNSGSWVSIRSADGITSLGSNNKGTLVVDVVQATTGGYITVNATDFSSRNYRYALIHLEDVLRTTKEKLVATVKPDNATNTNIKWSSTKESVAEVDANGNVTAIGLGNCNVVATAEDNTNGTLSATCSVTVS